jgi:6-phosphogluconolactonase (cycloisomerase 2 family)
MQNYTWATRTVFLTGVTVASLFTFGCGGGNNSGMTASRNTYAYVALADQVNGVGCLAQFQVSGSGALTPLSPATLGTNEAIPFGGGPLAVDPSGQYLFLAGYGGYGEVSQYVIGSDGTISLNATPYASNVMIDPGSITFTSSGLAIVTNGVVLNSYSLSSAGTLTPLNTAPVTNANSMVIDPSGQFLYIDDEFAVYSISTGGALTLNGTIPSENFPWSLVFSPKGMLYSVDYGAGTITQYSIDASTGIPTKVNSFTTGSEAGTSQPQGLAFNSTGVYAYVTNASENTVSQFAVDSTTGAFRKNGADVVTGRAPSPIAVDPSGRFVFVGNLVDATISEFTINEDGTLSPNGVVAGGPNPLNPDTPFPVAIAFSQR